MLLEVAAGNAGAIAFYRAAGFAEIDRRRRYYRLTAAGRKVLAAQRDNWRAFVEAVARVAGLKNA